MHSSLNHNHQKFTEHTTFVILQLRYTPFISNISEECMCPLRGSDNTQCIPWTTHMVYAWISKHVHSKVCDEITDPFSNFNGAVEVSEWISNPIPHFIMNVITYACWDLGWYYPYLPKILSCHWGNPTIVQVTMKQQNKDKTTNYYR